MPRISVALAVLAATRSVDAAADAAGYPVPEMIARLDAMSDDESSRLRGLFAQVTHAEAC